MAVSVWQDIMAVDGNYRVRTRFARKPYIALLGSSCGFAADPSEQMPGRAKVSLQV